MAHGFALVTPSYDLDYERCLLLVESVHRFVARSVQHFIIVSRDDLKLFHRCADERTHVLVQEEIVAHRFWRIPYARRWRFHFTMPPVRGWIWQQIVKMSIANSIGADAYMIVDSDCFFVRPFDPNSLIVHGNVPLFRKEDDWYKTHSDSQKWAEVSRRLLRLPPSTEPYGIGYIIPWCFWRRDVLLKLQAHLTNGRETTAWIRDVSRCITISEYTLYGIYVDKVLGISNSGHYAFQQHLCHEYWDTVPLNRSDLISFRHQMEPGHELVMISAKSSTPVQEIRSVFGF